MTNRTDKLKTRNWLKRLLSSDTDKWIASLPEDLISRANRSSVKHGDRINEEYQRLANDVLASDAAFDRKKQRLQNLKGKASFQLKRAAKNMPAEVAEDEPASTAEEEWITVNGARVKINENGVAIAGAGGNLAKPFTPGSIKDIIGQSEDDYESNTYALRMDDMAYEVGEPMPPSRTWRDGNPVLADEEYIEGEEQIQELLDEGWIITESYGDGAAMMAPDEDDYNYENGTSAVGIEGLDEESLQEAIDRMSDYSGEIYIIKSSTNYWNSGEDTWNNEKLYVDAVVVGKLSKEMVAVNDCKSLSSFHLSGCLKFFYLISYENSPCLHICIPR